MFTILENYKTLMRMCMSAQMGAETVSAVPVDSNNDQWVDVLDLNNRSETEIAAIKRMLDKAWKELYGMDGYANKVINENNAIQMSELINGGYLNARGEIVDVAHNQIIALSEHVDEWVQGTTGAAGVVGAVTFAANANYAPATNNDMSNLSTVTDASVLASLGDAWQEGLRVDNFNGKNYIVEWGAWKVDTGIFGSIDVANRNDLEDYQWNPRPIEEWKAKPYPGQGNEVEWATYKFQATVDGVTKTIYAVWMEVSKDCFALSEPLTTVYEQWEKMLEKCKYFVCDGAGCRVVPKQEVIETYVQPVFTQPTPAPEYVAQPTPTYAQPTPTYTQPAPTYTQPAPVESSPAVQPIEAVQKCKTYDELITANRLHTLKDGESDFWKHVIFNPTDAQRKKASSKDSYYTNNFVKIWVPKWQAPDGVEVTSIHGDSEMDYIKVPTLLVAKPWTRIQWNLTAFSSHVAWASQGHWYTDVNGNGTYEHGIDTFSPYNALCGPFNLRLPDIDQPNIFDPNGDWTDVAGMGAQSDGSSTGASSGAGAAWNASST